MSKLKQLFVVPRDKKRTIIARSDISSPENLADEVLNKVGAGLLLHRVYVCSRNEDDVDRPIEWLPFQTPTAVDAAQKIIELWDSKEIETQEHALLYFRNNFSAFGINIPTLIVAFIDPPNTVIFNTGQNPVAF